jgi:hypothetical protein
LLSISIILPRLKQSPRWPIIPEIRVVQANALELPFADGGFDFVLASLFLHHFEDEDAAKLFAFARVAGVALSSTTCVVSPIAWISIRVLTRIFTRNRLGSKRCCGLRC